MQTVNPDFHNEESKLLYLSSREAVADIVEHPCDVVLMVTGLPVHKVFYDAMHRLGIPVAMMLTESPYSDDSQLQMCRATQPAAVFVNERNSLLKFEQWHATYLPHSFDPARHYPRKVSREYQSDVCFIGTMYPERKELLDAIDWTGIHTRFIGPGLTVSNEQLQQDGKVRLDNAEVANYYCGAKINLNLHRTVRGAHDDVLVHIDDSEAWSIGPRAYEIAACGSFQIADSTRGELEEVFNGAVPTFRTASELERMVRYYLSNDEERQRIARLQHQMVELCSFEERARQIVLPILEALWQS